MWPWVKNPRVMRGRFRPKPPSILTHVHPTVVLPVLISATTFSSVTGPRDVRSLFDWQCLPWSLSVLLGGLGLRVRPVSDVRILQTTPVHLTDDSTRTGTWHLIKGDRTNYYRHFKPPGSTKVLLSSRVPLSSTGLRGTSSSSTL